MAGKSKNGSPGPGSKLVYLLKLLVLSFWIGGGLATYWLQSAFIWKDLGEQAAKIPGKLEHWFSISQITLGAAMCVLLFIADVSRKRAYLTFSAMVSLVLLAVLNLVTDFMYGMPLFFLSLIIALITFVPLALAGVKSIPPIEAKAGNTPRPQQETPPLPAAAAVEPPPPMSADPASERDELLAGEGMPGEEEPSPPEGPDGMDRKSAEPE